MGRTGHLVSQSTGTHPWHSSSREGQGLHSFDSPQGLKPSQQRVAANAGHQSRACARHLQEPMGTGIKKLLHCQV